MGRFLPEGSSHSGYWGNSLVVAGSQHSPFPSLLTWNFVWNWPNQFGCRFQISTKGFNGMNLPSSCTLSFCSFYHGDVHWHPFIFTNSLYWFGVFLLRFDSDDRTHTHLTLWYVNSHLTLRKWRFINIYNLRRSQASSPMPREVLSSPGLKLVWLGSIP